MSSSFPWPADWSPYHKDRLERYCHGRGHWVNGRCECDDQWVYGWSTHKPNASENMRYSAILQCAIWGGKIQWNETIQGHVQSRGIIYLCEDLIRGNIPDVAGGMLCFPTNYTQFEYEWHPYLSENIDCPYTWNRFMQRCECQEGVIYAKRNPLTSSVMLEADEWHIPCPKRGTGLALPDNGSHWLDRDIPAPERWPHIIPDCHGRGNWSEREGICICEEGWRSTYTPGGTREFCVKNVTTTRPPNSTHAPVWGRIVGVTPTPGQSNNSDTPMIVVAIPFLVVIVGQLFAILWLFKALRRQAKESSSAGTVEASPSGGSASPTGEIHNASAGPLVCAPVKSP